MHTNARTDYAEVRSQLIRRGHTARSWAMAHNFPVGSVYNALRGHRNGPRAFAIREAVMAFINARIKSNGR